MSVEGAVTADVVVAHAYEDDFVSHRRLLDKAADLGIGRREFQKDAYSVLPSLAVIPQINHSRHTYNALHELFGDFDNEAPYLLLIPLDTLPYWEVQLLDYFDQSGHLYVSPCTQLPRGIEDFTLLPEEHLCSPADRTPPTAGLRRLLKNFVSWHQVTNPARALEIRLATLKKLFHRVTRTRWHWGAVRSLVRCLLAALSRAAHPPGRLVTSSLRVTRGPNSSWMTSVLVIHGGAPACA